MLIIAETTECFRLACESCGAHATTDAKADSRRLLECDVCGAWEPVRAPRDAKQDASLALSA